MFAPSWIPGYLLSTKTSAIDRLKSQLMLHLTHENFYKKFFWEIETSMSRGEAERKGDTESKAGSRLWAVSTEPDAGLKLMDREIMTWAEVWCLTNWATQELLDLTILKANFHKGGE